MKNEKHTLLESAGIAYDTYTYEEYLEFCEVNDMEPKDENSEDYWNWVYDECQIDYECFFDNMSYSKAEHGKYVITYSLGLWCGNRMGYREKIYNSLSEAIKDALNSSRDYEDYSVEYDNGNIIVCGYHHDGRNYMTIRLLSKHGERNLAEKEEPNFERHIYNKDNFKKIIYNNLWA